jgi:hypothetical protein
LKSPSILNDRSSLMTRRLFILLVLVSGLPLRSSAGDGVNFAGSWSDPPHDSGGFSLDLTQAGNRIQGYHTAIALHGRRIDATLHEDGRPSITGTVVDGVAHLHFQSGYDERGRGDALLTFRGDKLEWKITKTTGYHYLPSSCLLSRDRKGRAKTRRTS